MIFNFKVWLKVIVSLSLIFFLMTLVEKQDLSTIDSNIVLYILSSIFVLLLALAAMAWRWKILINSFEKVSFFRVYKLYLVGSFFNIFLPGSIGGDVVRATYSSKFFRLGVKKAYLLIFFERVAGLIALAVTFSLGIFFYSEFDILGFNRYIPSIVLLFITLSIAVFKYWANKKISISNTFLLRVIALSFVGQYADIIIAYIFSMYFGLDLNIFQLMIIMPLVFIATVIPLSLGGTGVREGTMVALLSLFEVQNSTAVLISLLMYLSKIVVGLFGFPLYISDKTIEEARKKE